MTTEFADTQRSRRGILDFIEWAGNKLPEPATMFIVVAFVVMVLSHVGSRMGWSVQPLVPKMQPVLDSNGNPLLDKLGEPVRKPVLNEKTHRPVLEAQGNRITAVSLLTKEGVYWAITNLVNNFITFPPLGIILTAVMGVGLAERAGLIAAVLKALARAVPKALLTPTIIFLGINTSLTTDAGYFILPPAAAILFKAAGRSPIVGIAAATAGVAAGFSANLLITASDAMMAGFTETAARIIDKKYSVVPTCNWYFMIASTFILSLVGWAVTALFVEPRFRKKPPLDGGPAIGDSAHERPNLLTPLEIRGLLFASVAFALLLSLTLWSIFSANGPLHGDIPNTQRMRWTQAIVPIIFVSFIIPGFVYGLVAGTIRREKDATHMLIETIKSMAPVIVVYFFAAQFIEFFKYSNLGRMLSIVGGQFLSTTEVSTPILLVMFIFFTIAIDLALTSMSAKYAVMAPIFVPMMMMLGISPELTQAAYRVGDSVTNNIGPLNPYQVIIIKEMQKYSPKAGMGTLISASTPYSIVFAITWAILLLIWMKMGFPLGKGGPLWYVPTGG